MATDKTTSGYTKNININNIIMTEDDKQLEILIKMDSSLMEASKLVRIYDLAWDLKSSVIYMMNLWYKFHGTKHPRASKYGC